MPFYSIAHDDSYADWESNHEDETLKTVVIYHANCYDGFTAAWIAYSKIPNAVFIPAQWGDNPPWDEIKGAMVYVLDFCYERVDLVKMATLVRAIKVLDHHKTSESKCRGLSFCEFDMNRSGAGMAWDHFNPKVNRPYWINCVEDRDLWSFNHRYTEQVHAYMASLEQTFENWNQVHSMHIDEIVSAGEAIASYIAMYCCKLEKDSRTVDFMFDGEPTKGVVVNMPYLNSSEMGNHLLESFPNVSFAMLYYQRNDGRWQYSLRSRKQDAENTVDVSEIARSFSGGGHYSAAGFSRDYLLDELIQ